MSDTFGTRPWSALRLYSLPIRTPTVLISSARENMVIGRKRAPGAADID